MADSLYKLADDYQLALEQLTNLDLPEEAVRDTLEGMTGEIIEKGKSVAAFILNLDLELDKVKTVEQRLTARRKALESRIKSIREYLRGNMERCGITEIKADDGSFKAKLTKGIASVIIDDENKFPDNSPFVKWTKSISKTEIKKALEQGEVVEGARLETKPSLRLG